MKQSPYETFACTGYELNKIINEIQLELVVDRYGSMMDLSNEVGEPCVALVSNLKFNPKPFSHPLDIVVKNGDKMVIGDVRPFTKISKLNGFDITKTVEYDLARRRAVLHSIWKTADQYLLQNALSPLTQIYASWISESLSKHLNVDAFTQLKIANIAAWWFWCQCNKEEGLDDYKRSKIYREICEATRSSYETVEEDLNDIAYFDSIETFCEEVKSRTDATRLKHLDPASLIQLASGGWMGTWSREIMSVAIEYPPYLIAVVYSAMHERGTRSAMFSKFVQRFATRPELKGFKTAIDRISSVETGAKAVSTNTYY